MRPGTSIGGTRLIQKPMGPIAFIPAISTVANVMMARTAVTLRLAVAEAPPGIIPMTLLNRTKKNTVQRSGRNLSASWPPIAGRATPSLMNMTRTSNTFRNRPRVTGCLAVWRASGMMIAAISTAATSSITMNRVT